MSDLLKASRKRASEHARVADVETSSADFFRGHLHCGGLCCQWLLGRFKRTRAVSSWCPGAIHRFSPWSLTHPSRFQVPDRCTAKAPSAVSSACGLRRPREPWREVSRGQETAGRRAVGRSLRPKSCARMLGH